MCVEESAYADCLLVCRQEPMQAGRMKSQKKRRSDNQPATEQNEISNQLRLAHSALVITSHTEAKNTFECDYEIRHMAVAIIEHG